VDKFKKIIPFGVAVQIIVALNISVILFHILVMLQVIPMDVIWGGRLESEREMYVFESASIIVNGLLIAIVLAKKKSVQTGKRHVVINAALWAFVVLFLFNTLGNTVAKTTVETLVATPLTLLLAILCFRLAIERT
jgi:hypothetical protein